MGGTNQFTREVFYDDLDTVRFGPAVPAEDHAVRGVAAMGTLMLGMLLCDTAPVLSLPQVYDNALVLNLVTPSEGPWADHEDRLAFLRLARDGYVKVGVRGAARENPLSEAFCRALRDSEFVLSGWPELDDAQLRRDVGKCLERDPKQIGSIVPSDRGIEAKIQGLQDLERNLQEGTRANRGSLKFVPPKSGVSLYQKVRQSLKKLPEESAVLTVAEWVITRAEAISTPDDRNVGNLDNRSTWYTLVSQCDLPVYSSHVRTALLDIVDAEYNTIVANSLDANGLSITCDDEETARRLAEAWHIGEGAKQRAVTLIPLRSEENWLTWSETRHKLDELLVARVDDRLNILEGLRQQWIDDFRARNSAGVAVRLALPRALGITAPTTFITTYVSGVPPHLAGGAAVVGGALDILTATPSARRTLAGLEAAAKAGLPWRDSSIRTGAARWLQEMLGRMW